MQIYTFDKITGEFLAEEIADENPLEKDEFLIPANATSIAPPAASLNEIAVFDGSVWALVDDYRGQVHFAPDGIREVISVLGEMVPAGNTTTEPPDAEMTWDGTTWVYDLPTVRAAAFKALNIAAEKAFETITAPYFPKERESWGKQEAEAKAWNADNTAITPFLDKYVIASGMSKTDIVANILAKATAFEEASGTIVGQLAGKRTAIAAAATAAEIKAVDLTFTA